MKQALCWECVYDVTGQTAFDVTDALTKHLDAEHPGWMNRLWQDADTTETESPSPASA